jgi:hypothetical protein
MIRDEVAGISDVQTKGWISKDAGNFTLLQILQELISR